MLKFSEGSCMTIEPNLRAVVIGCHCEGPKELELAELLFEFCSYCGCSSAEMSTIGHSAFAVCKVRQNEEKALTKIQSIEHEKEKPYGYQYNIEQAPTKYNSKMMDSIWGMYNRYSVHNLKKNMDDKNVAFAADQQSQTVGSAASASNERSHGDSKTAKSPQLLPGFWAPIDYSY